MTLSTSTPEVNITLLIIYIDLLTIKYTVKISIGFQWSALAWGALETSYACVHFSRLSIASVDGKQHLSEVVFSALVGFPLYTTSTRHRVKQSPKSTTGMSSVAYVMLCGAKDRSCGASITMLQHIPRTWFRLWGWLDFQRSRNAYSPLPPPEGGILF